jgi:hypothetical protein
MDNPTLIFREDSATGLPCLEASGVRLNPDDLQSLQRQIHHRYHEFVGTEGGQVIALHGSPGSQLPRYYRVFIRWREGERCPTLLLYAADPKTPSIQESHEVPGVADSKTDLSAQAWRNQPTDEPVFETEVAVRSQTSSKEHAFGNWQAGFFAELAELFADGSNPAQQSPIDFVLSDLRAVLKKNPKVFALLLFAGYLEAADAICRRHGTPLENRYVAAARMLKDRFGNVLPEGALDLLLE